jgi:septum site-determining protein MinC
MFTHMERNDFSIKGIRQGLLVRLGGGDWEQQLDALETRLSENPDFFRGGKLALDVGSAELSVEDLEAARDLLQKHEVELISLVCTDSGTLVAARELELLNHIDLPRARAHGGDSDDEDYVLYEGWVVRCTLRSGQVLRHPSHVVVIGDANPGSEVVAGGNVVVWGKLRGMVHAGALGDEGAVVCALDLAPMQLRIANHIARSPEDRPSDPVPEMARVSDGQIVAVPWHR